MAFKDTCPTLKKVGADEPIFVLRAGDLFSDELVDRWASMLTAVDGNTDKVEEARDCAEQMRQWPDRKIPD